MLFKSTNRLCSVIALSIWHQLQDCQVLCGPAARDSPVHLQPEPETGETASLVEDFLRGTGAKKKEGSTQLQASGIDFSPDVFSSAFNTIQPSLLRDKMDCMRVDQPPLDMGPALPHKQTPVCEVKGLCVSPVQSSAAWELHKGQSWPPSCSPSTPWTLPITQQTVIYRTSLTSPMLLATSLMELMKSIGD